MGAVEGRGREIKWGHLQQFRGKKSTALRGRLGALFVRMEWRGRLYQDQSHVVVLTGCGERWGRKTEGGFWR